MYNMSLVKQGMCTASQYLLAFQLDLAFLLIHIRAMFVFNF